MRAESYVTAQNLDQQVKAWKESIFFHVRARPHWRLDPLRAALLLIDVQRAFCDPQGAHFLPAFAAIEPRLTHLVQAWRRAGRPVAWTRHAHAHPQMPCTHGDFWGSLIDAASPDAEFRMTPAPGEWAERKETYDAFYGTTLEEFLHQKNCTQVVVAGVLTHLCVETTVRAAFVRGFAPFAVMDACAANMQIFHENSLLAMAAGFAGIMTAQEVIEACR